ncbi:MAG: hypothetical protein V4642_07280 [Bacteroidota bacterium]
MKKLLPLALCIAMTTAGISYAQQTGTTPEGFKYQASLRNTQGEVIADKLVSIRISILSKGSNVKGNNSEAVYSEVHRVSTNKLGMVSFEIGNGTLTTGDFSIIHWGDSEHFVQIEIDEAGGDNYKVLGTSQLMSVPYSLHAKMASDVMPGSITIQNEISARKEADEKLQTQINIVRNMLNEKGAGKGGDNTLGIAQDLEALDNRFKADSSAKNTRINNNLTRFTNDSTAKQTQITNNLTRFKNDSVAVRGLISTEQTRATNAESTLQTNLNTEITNRTAGVTAETNRATTAETDLQNQINTLNNSSSTSIAAEAARAQSAEDTLDGKIITEKNRAEGIEGGLRIDLNAEIARATAAEETNATAITNEAATARGAEAGLDSRLTALEGADSAQAVINADQITTNTNLQSAIDTEATTARAAETGLDTRVTALETTDAAQQTINTDIQNAIDAEVTTARAAESGLNTAITDEVTRATAAEQVNADAIATEANRAQAAEAALEAAAGTKWGNTGNAGTDAGTNFIGTTDNVDLVTKTNNQERLRITSGGQVEINTTTGSLLLPRLTTEQRDVLTPTPGMTIYNATTNTFQGYSVAAGGVGTETLDQNNPSTEYAGIGFDSYGQSFTAGTTGALTKLGLNVYDVYTPGEYTFNIKNGTSGTSFYSQTISINSAGDQTFPITGSVELTSGSIYTFWLEPVGGSYATGYYSGSNIYTGGDLFAWPYDYYYNDLYDLNFSTYITPGTSTNFGWYDMAGDAPAGGSETSGLQAQIEAETSRATTAEATKWGNTGNAGTDANTNFIGTTDEVDLVAKTNNMERLRITSSGQMKIAGSVEINTTTGSLTLPRLTEVERNALNPSIGMTIYNTTANKFQGYAASTGGNEALDQSNTTQWSGIHITEAGQSFTAGSTGLLTKIGLDIMYVNTPGDYTLKIKDSESNTPFYSQTVSVNSAGEQLLPITGTVNVSSGAVYTFWFEPIGDSYAVTHLSEDSYPGGSMYIWPYNEVNPGYDINFKTYITATMGWQDMTGGQTATSGGGTPDLSTLWTKTGNAGTDASANFIGTTDEVDLVAKTNNTERLRITSAGSVNLSGQLNLNTTTGSLVLPRLTEEQRNVLPNPTPGMMVYNATAGKFQGYAAGAVTEAIDQSHTERWSGIQLNEFGQSFTAGTTGKLTKLGLDIYYIVTPGDWVLKIRNGTSGTAFHEQTVTINEGGEHTFNISGDVNLTSGNVYTFWCEPVGNSYAVLHLTENTYPGGDIYQWGSDQYLPYDIDFKTYVTAAASTWQDMSGASTGSNGGGNTSTPLALPKLTTAQRDALTPEPGMQIFNTSSMRFQGYGAGSVGGVEALDQSNLVEWDGGGFNDAGQSFTAGATGTLSKIEANIYYVNQPGDYILKIKSGTTGSNAPFYTQTVTVTTGGWTTFALTGAVDVTSGEAYTFWFEAVGNSYAVMHISDQDAYTGGDMYYAPNNSFSQGYDWGFKTYITPLVLGWQNLH